MGDGKTTPARTPLSETISNAMRKRGFQFVGPVIVYAWMQAVGIVTITKHSDFDGMSHQSGDDACITQ